VHVPRDVTSDEARAVLGPLATAAPLASGGSFYYVTKLSRLSARPIVHGSRLADGKDHDAKVESPLHPAARACRCSGGTELRIGCGRPGFGSLPACVRAVKTSCATYGMLAMLARMRLTLAR
jgi:hypothetical protein